MGCKSMVSRRNISKKQDRVMWNELKTEVLPLRYRLHYSDGTAQNVKTGRRGLIAQIKETRPVRIERLS